MRSGLYLAVVKAYAAAASLSSPSSLGAPLEPA
jgi:hypothetical protein